MTVSLNAYTKAYPFITNRIRATVAKASEPLAIVASIVDTTPGHPERTWSFPGLERTNYIFNLEEINDFNEVVANLANFNVVPGEIEGLLYRPDEQIKVGLTAGLVAGQQTFTFDGTSGKPDYRGWDITISEIYGRGIMAKGVDFSWNKTSGLFTLLISNDSFQDGQIYNVHFDPIQQPQTGGEPSVLDQQIKRVALGSAYYISLDDFGKRIVFDVNTTYQEVFLPKLSEVPSGRMLHIEIDASSILSYVNIKFRPDNEDGDIIRFVYGNLNAIHGESFSIYKSTKGLTNEWRVTNIVGNFRECGRIVSHENPPTDGVISGMIPMDGRRLNYLQYLRLYEDVVTRLPSNQVCNYDDWNTGNNKYLYSLANSSNPSDYGFFRVPDRRNLYERNNSSTGKAGDYLNDDVKPHKHKNGVSDNNSPGRPFVYGWTTEEMPGSSESPIRTEVNPNQVQGFTATDGGEETRPKSYLINKFILL